jgi:hypothetical protein
MAQGYEGKIAIGEQYQGWGSENITGMLLLKEPESETLDYNMEKNTRSGKIRGVRSIRLSDVSFDTMAPGGGIVFQPRTEELAPILLSHFQCVNVEGGTVIAGTFKGTLGFCFSESSPDFVGSTWGTWKIDSGYQITANDIYCMRLEKGMGTINELSGGDANFLFQHAIANEMEWRVTYDSDLVVTPTFIARGTVPNQALLSARNMGTYYSSFSDRFTGWAGTLTWDGTSNVNLDVEEWGLTTRAGGAGRGRIGAYGFQTYPFSESVEEEGRMRLEFKSAKLMKRLLSGTGTFAFAMRFHNSATNWIEINHYHCMFEPYTPQNAGADQLIETDFTFGAYGSAGTPATIVKMFAEFATSLFSIDAGVGTSR